MWPIHTSLTRGERQDHLCEVRLMAAYSTGDEVFGFITSCPFIVCLKGEVRICFGASLRSPLLSDGLRNRTGLSTSPTYQSSCRLSTSRPDGRTSRLVLIENTASRSSLVW